MMQAIAILISTVEAIKFWITFLSQTTWRTKARFEPVHINASFMKEHGRASDHDPVLVQIDFSGAQTPGTPTDDQQGNTGQPTDQTIPSSSNTGSQLVPHQAQANEQKSSPSESKEKGKNEDEKQDDKEEAKNRNEDTRKTENPPIYWTRNKLSSSFWSGNSYDESCLV